jgi:hypothetical protein
VISNIKIGESTSPLEPLQNLDQKCYKFMVLPGNNAALIIRVMSETFRNKYWSLQQECFISYNSKNNN